MRRTADIPIAKVILIGSPEASEMKRHGLDSQHDLQQQTPVQLQPVFAVLATVLAAPVPRSWLCILQLFPRYRCPRNLARLPLTSKAPFLPTFCMQVKGRLGYLHLHHGTPGSLQNIQCQECRNIIKTNSYCFECKHNENMKGRINSYVLCIKCATSDNNTRNNNNNNFYNNNEMINFQIRDPVQRTNINNNNNNNNNNNTQSTNVIV